MSQSKMRVFRPTCSPHDASVTPMSVYLLPVISVESVLVSCNPQTAVELYKSFHPGSGSGNLHTGSSLQDVHSHVAHPEAKSSSACSLHDHSSDSGIYKLVGKLISPIMQFSALLVSAGSSEYESASQHSSSGDREKKSPVISTESQTQEEIKDITTEKDTGSSRKLPDNLDSKHPKRGNSVTGSELWVLQRPLSDGYSLSYPRSHRREPTDSTSSPSRVHHRRINSLSISGYSSRSTSAYSTLSERSERPTVATEDSESLISSRTRATTQSQVEQSRVDTSRVIDELMQESDLSRSAEEEPSQLQMYVDRSNKGGLVVAGPNLERLAAHCLSECIVISCLTPRRRYFNLKPIELSAPSSSSKSSNPSNNEARAADVDSRSTSKSKADSEAHRTHIPPDSS